MPKTQVKSPDKIKCAGCFKSLGIDARIEIYSYLRQKKEATVSELVKLVKLTQPTVSYHLKEMKDLGLLDSRKVGKEVYYKIQTQCRDKNCDCILNLVQIPPVYHA